ncbi:MAG: hypothetical protein H6745_31735 [Deltaproteobacteria bacterium]|nr:hypothetical protein [Deltaproteobacteria bacterium]
MSTTTFRTPETYDLSFAGDLDARLLAGESPSALADELEAGGIPREVAVQAVLSRFRRAAANAPGERGGAGAAALIVLGLILTIVGIAVSAGSYAEASRAGGHYVVLYGLVIAGASMVARGLKRALSA